MIKESGGVDGFRRGEGRTTDGLANEVGFGARPSADGRQRSRSTTVGNDASDGPMARLVSFSTGGDDDDDDYKWVFKASSSSLFRRADERDVGRNTCKRARYLATLRSARTPGPSPGDPAARGSQTSTAQ